MSAFCVRLTFTCLRVTLVITKAFGASADTVNGVIVHLWLVVKKSPVWSIVTKPFSLCAWVSAVSC